MFRALITATAVLAASLALAGTAQAAPDPAAVAAGPAGIIYVATVRPKLAPEHQDASAASLIAVAVTTCQAFDQGVTAPEMLGVFLGNGFSAWEAGVLTGGAVAAICPEHQAELTAELNI